MLAHDAVWVSSIGKGRAKKRDFKVSADLPAPRKNLGAERGLLFSGTGGKYTVFLPLLVAAELMVLVEG